MVRLTRSTRISLIVTAVIAWHLSSCCSDSEASCSEAVCARVVTKCLLTEHCKCDFAGRNYTCHKHCFSCLAELCYDCCSCFGMCPKTPGNVLNKVSNIEELDEPIPQLFEIYAGLGSDEQLPPRYTALTFLQEKRMRLGGGQIRVIRRNCTVAYITKCMTSEDCNTMCQNMGASYTRWFHDGCCECVGNSCFDYGLGEGKCARCPPNFEKYADQNDLYYGEDDDDEYFEEIDDYHNNWTTNITYEDEKVAAARKARAHRD
ncbi:twisted gastrulation protein homolog 1-A-like [Phymastichus coffea]|uniref:twisted gastrulation protein homolog 1-A-like n=1 Tax=Phymastichus coffea TaxID=108790 RepID=UPI00273B3818|nr:twisted gastrulation protein homolog 1-A-like [Phymastichus coffea]